MAIIQLFKLIITMALRNIIRQKKRSFIVASTAAVGLFFVTLSQGFVNGFIDSMLFVAIESGLGHVQIRPPDYIDTRQPGLRLKNSNKIRIALKNKLKHGMHYSQRIESEALLRLGSDIKGVLILGLDPNQEKNVSNIPEWIIDGSFFDSKTTTDQAYSCLIGNENAQDLELETGDWFVLTTGQENSSSISFRCTISGIFRAPSKLMETRMIFMPRSQISNLRYEADDETSYFVFLGNNYKNTNEMKTQIMELTKGIPDSKTYSYTDLEPFISNYLEMTDQFTWIIYVIILIGFGIVLFENVLMSIFERIHEIGIIGALGAKRSFLFWLVLIEAFFLTLGGAIMSLIPGFICIGLLSYTGVNFEEFNMGDSTWVGSPGIVYPFITFKDVLTGIMIASIVSFFSGIYPAIKAVRISPVKAIHGH